MMYHSSNDIFYELYDWSLDELMKDEKVCDICRKERADFIHITRELQIYKSVIQKTYWCIGCKEHIIENKVRQYEYNLNQEWKPL